MERKRESKEDGRGHGCLELHLHAAKKKAQFYIIFNFYRKQIGETDFEQPVGINRLRHYWRNKIKSLPVCPVFFS
jgi:hypothetical protein